MHITFFNQFCNTANRLNTSSGTVTYQNRRLHTWKNPSADMFHSRFIIYYKIRIIVLQLLKLRLKKSIYKTVAAFPLCASHNKKIKIIIFHQCRIKFNFCIICLGHTSWNRAVLCHLRTCDFFTDISECIIDIHAKHFIQIGIGICIDCKNRPFANFAQILNQHTA